MAAHTVARMKEPKVLTVTSAQRWEDWLAQHHDRTPQGVWLRLFKQASNRKSPTWTEAVDVALCFGWIDGQAKSYDDDSRVQRFTPRRARSVWSRLNTERVARLIETGRMRPSGLAEVEAAQRDGRWARAYDPPSTATVPDDFLSELSKHKQALAFYRTLDKRNTYPITYRLQNAKTSETRTKRIKAIIDMFERGEKFHD
jgi:uncharacterized protein YdeI (YjbR/CyaY-like superfamily)